MQLKVAHAADSIVAHLKDVLLRCILPLNKCRGQGYDGAAAMSGTEIPWCSTQLQQQEPREYQFTTWPIALICVCKMHANRFI